MRVLILVIMTDKYQDNHSSLPTGLASGLALSPTPTFDIGLVFNAIIAPAPSDIADCIVPMVINPHMTFYYRKMVTIKDLTSSKLYMKRTIQIERILFSNTTQAWNYMVGILDNECQAEVAKDFGL